MILWLTIGVLVISTIGYFIIDNMYSFNSFRDFLQCVFLFLIIITLIASIAMGLVAITNHSGLDGYVAAAHTRYKSLWFQLEYGIYDNENDVGKYELYRDIRLWNEDLSRNQEMQRDFWLGVFTPNIYDQFQYIDIGGIVSETR